MSPKIEKIIVKYLTKSASANDLDVLSRWIKIPSNIELFKDFVKTHYVINYSVNNPDTEKLLIQLLMVVRKEKSFLYKLRNQSVYKYTAAAILVGMMVFAYLFKDNMHLGDVEENTPVIVHKVVEPGSDKATLTLANGEQVALEEGTFLQTQNANSDGVKIIYEASESDFEKTEYNYLTIPRGGQFFVKLSDGTQVWLNSESQLKYPVKFKEGESRIVELVYGEGYFEVSPSSKHKGASFQVVNKSQIVEVIGTEFNIKAYKDESNVYTTLVEGRVVVNVDDLSSNLKPSQQLNLNKENKDLIVKTVDVYNQISWKDGVFSFDEKSLKEMMVILSRWYDVDVEFQNKSIENEMFSGVLRKSQSLEEILNSIKNFEIIKDFEITDKKVILN
ncbi:FecR family protein [Algibacter amylolyticus]|uniref:FecR family protein n=1 Tax=Algibacter amylolyticus TaxID=1608400 RepID=A0A5M7BDB5_9FLAO|nr:FecR family protein [Algibacter amylolyticus]KAA5825125.1 FecR family protein [Algibacter amylolyticus]MBB5268767.1 hypothetical protein [Algibacter amylolyticus]TSJ77619.1 FecR family protein [Algibacter amylolyticus]